MYLPGLGRPALWEPDEGRYGEIAREMYLSADYVTPRDNYVRYFEKPPLVYWTEAAAISIFGVDEFAVRLPAAVFSAAQVVVTAAIAEVMFGAAVGLLAAWVVYSEVEPTVFWLRAVRDARSGAGIFHDGSARRVLPGGTLE